MAQSPFAASAHRHQPHRAPSSAVAALRWWLAVAGVALVVGCEAASKQPPVGGLPLLTIPVCQGMGGFPLFDPEDERPIDESCPGGLRFLGEFDESFFGADGGICCSGPEAMVDRDVMPS